MNYEGLLLGTAIASAVALAMFIAYVLTQLPAIKPRLKHVARITGLGLALYVATFIGCFLLMLLSFQLDSMSIEPGSHMIASDFVVNLLATLSIGWLYGLAVPRDQPIIMIICTITWHLLTILFATLASRRIGHVTTWGWKIAIPLFVILILLLGLLGAVVGHSIDSHYGPMGNVGNTGMGF